MTLTDDMVFEPSIGEERVASAPTRARVERRLAGANRRGGVMSKLRAANQVRRGIRAYRAAKSSGRVVRMARAGASGLSRGVGRLGARAAGTPVGLVVGALLVAGVVALRLGSGQPLEGTSEQISQMLLGDKDDEARAKMRTRQQFSGDSDLTRIAGQEGISNQMQGVFEDLYKINKRSVDGEELFRREFPANNVLDMLIVRARDKFVSLWNGTGGDAQVQELANRIGSHTGTHADCRGGR